MWFSQLVSGFNKIVNSVVQLNGSFLPHQTIHTNRKFSVTNPANKRSLADRIAQKLRSTHRDADAVLTIVLSSLEDAILDDRKIVLKGFGTFECRVRKGREYKHPLTGEQIPVPDKMGLIFKPSDTLAKRVRGVKGVTPVRSASNSGNSPIGSESG